MKDGSSLAASEDCCKHLPTEQYSLGKAWAGFHNVWADKRGRGMQTKLCSSLTFGIGKGGDSAKG